MRIRSKDFLETAEGLIFAVLLDEPEQDRYLCFLRYIRTASGFRKLTSEEANRVVSADFPHYRFHSRQRDVDLHAVSRDQICRHHSAARRVSVILETAQMDPIERKTAAAIRLIEENGISPACLGVTGSLLIGAQSERSDIDLVVYGRAAFNRLRDFVRSALQNRKLDPLSESQWRETFFRRGCSLSFAEYVWHERRKCNKASLDGTKIDFSLLAENPAQEHLLYRKIKPMEIVARVTDASLAFDTPARYRVSHPQVSEVCSFTPTYAGQVLEGETLIARGIVEESDSGVRHLVIGSSREAPGEFIKVARSGN
ncbi:MAG: hypothetical protein ACU843_15060 [Gammaproteobacteria bacterium]